MSIVDDLVTWLRAQLDEDERVAKAWLPFGNPTAADREHIARHDPARVLRDVEAKRRTLDEVVPMIDDMDGLINGSPRTKSESDHLIKLLALPYVDRPGYREEWRPVKMTTDPMLNPWVPERPAN